MKEQPRVFLARAGQNGEDEDYALENGMAIIGYRDAPSLVNAKDYDDVYKLVETAFPAAKPRAVGNYTGQLWAFSLAMKEGDIVVLPRKLTSQIALGRVTGPYRYLKIGEEFRHTRAVDWVRPDVPRTAIEQDLLYSLGAALTVCNISRNEAAQRIAAVMEGKSDPGPSLGTKKSVTKPPPPQEMESEAVPDLSQAAHDQILGHIKSNFSGHALARLVDAVLVSDGWTTKVSPPGPDGGVDILAGRGPLGLDAPRLCVQVKSQNSPTDVTVYRTLQGVMQTFKAEQGLLVCWGGFNKVVLTEAKQGHFMVRLWDSQNLVDAIYRTYEQLPAEIKADLPLKRAWLLVADGTAE